MRRTPAAPAAARRSSAPAGPRPPAAPPTAPPRPGSAGSAPVGAPCWCRSVRPPARCGAARSEPPAARAPARTSAVVTRQVRAVKASTRPSTSISPRRGRFDGCNARSSPSASVVTSSPSAPPATASTALSVSSCRAMAQRLAPSAVRSANSPSRTVARTSSRWATLAHAISSTSATAPSRTSSAGRACLTTSSCSGTARIRTLVPACSGNSLRNWSAIPFISACAWANVTSGRRRPKTVKNV